MATSKSGTQFKAWNISFQGTRPLNTPRGNLWGPWKSKPNFGAKPSTGGGAFLFSVKTHSRGELLVENTLFFSARLYLLSSTHQKTHASLPGVLLTALISSPTFFLPGSYTPGSLHISILSHSHKTAWSLFMSSPPPRNWGSPPL